MGRHEQVFDMLPVRRNAEIGQGHGRDTDTGKRADDAAGGREA